MAGGLGDLFNDQRNAPAMAAPGTPAAALTGSPAATLTNLAAISGANAGASLGGALGGLVGLPTANPAAMLEARQAEFAKLFDEVKADGTVMTGDAMGKAGKMAYQKGILTPQEYMKLQSVAIDQKEKDAALLGKSVEFLNKNKAVEEYRLSSSIFGEMREMAKRPDNTTDDFAMIQMGIKVLDPGSVTSQNEIATGRLSIIGEQALNAIGFDVNQLLNWAAYGGKKPTFTREQKARWLKTIGSRVNASANAASQVYSAAREQFQASGGPAPVFDAATQSTFGNITGESFVSQVERETGEYSQGTIKPLTGRMQAAKDFVSNMISNGPKRESRRTRQGLARNAWARLI